jgi:3',5'-cyclic AMP phosphodiesterase CpdA
VRVPTQVHLQFGADAATQMAVSWASEAPAERPVVVLGRPGAGLGHTVEASERRYADAMTRETVWTYHALLGGLRPDTEYVYEVRQRCARPARGRFRTGPACRSRPFRFTSFGDLSIPAPVGAGLGPASAHAARTVAAVERAAPLFHLLNGDLAYANVSDAPVATWSAFFANLERSATRRPWMPCAGNHENEAGNGPHGYEAYQARFCLPGNGAGDGMAGNWYAFTVGSVRVLSLNGDDVCLQDGGFSAYRYQQLPPGSRRDAYVRGYSGEAQRAWLERTLAAARDDPGIDWVIVCMHQVAMSSAAFNGADLGVREALLPVFDRYGVDLVLGGHEHHYERTHPVRGVEPGSALLTPARADGGTVHVTIGVGGNPNPCQPDAYGTGPRGVVICEVGRAEPGRQRAPRRVEEPAPWLAARSVAHPYGFTVFDVDPGLPGGSTTISATHYGAAAGGRPFEVVDRFTLGRPRRDGTEAVSGAPAARSGSPRP